MTRLITETTTLKQAISPASQRFESLDSLRGIAALTVVFAHFSTLFDRPHELGLGVLRNPGALVSNNWMFLLKLTPLCIFMQGHAAVVLFFLLSGFVLTIPFARPNVRIAESNFLLRRVVRIYPSYLAALVLAITCDWLFSVQGLPKMSPWFNKTWNRPVNQTDVIAHLLFIGNYDFGQFNTAFWSLVYEMRVSLIFPLLYRVIRVLPVKIIAILSATLIITGTLGSSEDPDWLYTLSVIGIFLAGSLTYLHREILVGITRHLSCRQRRAVLVVSLLGFGYSASTIRHLTHLPLAGDLLLTLFSVALLTLAISDDLVQGFLHHRYSLFLGKVSYSLYLTHATVIFTVVYISRSLWGGPDGAAWWSVILLTCLCAILVLSWLFYIVVEQPSSNWSRRFSFYRQSPSAKAKISV